MKKKIKDVKPFKIDGEDCIEIVHMHSEDGPKFIDVFMNHISYKQARKLSEWLLLAANECEQYNKARAHKKGKQKYQEIFK